MQTLQFWTALLDSEGIVIVENKQKMMIEKQVTTMHQVMMEMLLELMLLRTLVQTLLDHTRTKIARLAIKIKIAAHEELEEGEKRTKRLNVNSRDCGINNTTDKKQGL